MCVSVHTNKFALQTFVKRFIMVIVIPHLLGRALQVASIDLVALGAVQRLLVDGNGGTVALELAGVTQDRVLSHKLVDGHLLATPHGDVVALGGDACVCVFV